MSASCAPCLSQLVCTATPNLVEVEKATLKARFVTASVALIAEAKCLPDDKPELWEEKGEVYPIVEHGQELDIDIKIDTVDRPAIAEADEAYKRWSVEEVAAAACRGSDEGEEEVTQEAGEGQGMGAAMLVVMERMLHVEVLQPACKTIAESDDDGKPKGTPCFRPSSKTCDWCVKMKQGCEKSNKGVGKKVQAGASVVRSTKAPKAGPSKQAHNDDDKDDDVEVVKTCAHSKGKAPVCGRFDGKTASDISQALGMVRAEAVAAHAANLRLQVHIEQLLEALAKLGVE
ncbi:hypothetical protein M404DRAFT_32858 [Pisolithus tinctorius Marx 270]|uniref:Uncharacterized protein n=1 Tax=Pisolithus tinctorius Marx 270 TaxID=870435 RepID=A0A0C3NML2_PISTI|nr:hypothetical protein M404DRAFT_32858 [Pisolithus tinctorius Marx 270]